MKAKLLLLSLFVSLALQAQDTPLMGWSSWNTFGFKITDRLIMQEADAIHQTGLYDCGYNYINIDDGYFGGRDAEGNLLIHSERFPGGMKAVVDYIHSKKLKAGIYTDAGHNTCASYFGGDKIGVGVGIYQHETADCNLWFRDLSFDFIKIDFCGGSSYHNADKLHLDERTRYTDIARAIAATGRKVRLNVCRWDYPGTWVSEVAGSWRTTGDINCSWGSVKGILQQNLYLAAYSSAGHYNDMDMLEVGRGLSPEEDRTHFGMWCIMNSPLLVGCDMRNIKPEPLALMSNRELIALNQDPLCQQAYVVAKSNGCYVLVRDIVKAHGKQRAIAIYNPTDEEQRATVNVQYLDLSGRILLRDLYQHTDATSLLNAATGDITVSIPAHGTRIYKLTAERRLEQRRYEAEAAYVEAYQELINNEAAGTARYDYDDHCSGGLICRWLGRSEQNALQFRDVHSLKGGAYALTIAYQGNPDTRQIQVLVNGQRADFLTCPAAQREPRTVRLNVALRKGQNNITLRNLQAYMPDIDYIELTPLKQ